MRRHVFIIYILHFFCSMLEMNQNVYLSADTDGLMFPCLIYVNVECLSLMQILK